MNRMRARRWSGTGAAAVAVAALAACSSSPEASSLPPPTRDAAAAGSSGGNGASAGGAGGGPIGGAQGGSSVAGATIDDGSDASGPSGGGAGSTTIPSEAGAGGRGDGAVSGSGGAGGAGAAGPGGAAGSSTVRDAAVEGNVVGEGGSLGTDLFNGTDLTGWDISTTWPPALASRPALTAAEAQRIFRVESGVIHVYSDAVDGSDQVRATLTTVASYSKYRLSVDYRWGTKKFSPYVALARDAGILFHVTGDRRKVWPDSTEFQIKENETGDIYALNSTCTSLAVGGGLTFVDVAAGGVSKLVNGTGGNAPHHHLVGMFELPDWNTVELTVNQDTAVYVVNGRMVNKVFNIKDTSGRAVITGPIVLQAEHAEVFYRNVRLQVLP
jgi:hypothetical protein